MKRQIRSSSDSSPSGCWYNVSWYTQFGDQCGECVLVPAEECYDPYSYIEHYLVNTYGDEYGGIADYIESDGDENGDIWDAGYQPIISSISEEEQLDQAILDGRPFDLATFEKYKVDPYRAKGAVRASELKEGDIIQVTEDASEIDCPSPELEIFKIYRNDPDGYDDYGLKNVLTFDCWDNETGDEYRLHFWPTEYVGPIISRKSDYAIKSATDVDDDDDWEWSPYHGGTYRVDGAYGATTFTDDPVEAITLWFKMQKDAWADTSIMCETRAQALELLKAATPELLTKLFNTYKQPYKLEYLIESVEKAIERNCYSFHESKYGYGDSIHPFSVG